MGGCMGGWVGWWVGSGQITKNWIYLDLIEIFQFCLKIQHLWRLPHPSTHPTTHIPTHGWGSLHRCWIFKQNWNISIRSRYIQFLVIWPDPTHQPTQPPIHPPMGGGATTDVKSSNRTEISWFVLNLMFIFTFYLYLREYGGLNFYWNELPIVTPYSLRYK